MYVHFMVNIIYSGVLVELSVMGEQFSRQNAWKCILNMAILCCDVIEYLIDRNIVLCVSVCVSHLFLVHSIY